MIKILGNKKYIGVAIYCLTAIIIFIFVLRGDNISLKWHKLQLPGENKDDFWHGLAQSANGKYVLAGIGGDAGGRLYLSADYGKGMAEVQPAGDKDYNWTHNSMNSDGSRMLAMTIPGRIYISEDFGQTWRESMPEGDADHYWHGSCMSKNGAIIITVSSAKTEVPGKLYRSINGGISWNELHPTNAIGENYSRVSCSDDGKLLVAIVSGGRVYRSSDGGDNWEEIMPDGNKNYLWWFVSSDGKGKNILLDNIEGRAYISRDFGNSWSSIGSIFGFNWAGLDISKDGQIYLIGQNATIDGMGRLYLSFNKGATWSETRPAGDTDRYWHDVSISADNSHFLASSFGGSIYAGSVSWGIPF